MLSSQALYFQRQFAAGQGVLPRNG